MPEEVRANTGQSEGATGRPHTSDKVRNPEDFCKNKSSVREKMASDLRDTPPEERMRGGSRSRG